MKRIFALVIALFITISAFSQVPSYVPSIGLAGYWSFTGDAIDDTGNGNNGTVHGATLTPDRFGNANSAYDFLEANKNYIELNNTIGKFGTSDFSISIWFTTRKPPSYLICKRNTETYNNFWVFRSDWFEIDQSNQSDYDTIRTNVIISLNNWYHYVITRSSSSLKLYINGVQKNVKNTALIQNITNNNPMEIGAQVAPVSGVVGRHDGKIDDIGIWNRALTQQEITDLFNGTPTGTESINSKESIKIYPNPAHDFLTIDLGNYEPSGSSQIRIINPAGQQIFQSQITQQQLRIDLSKWTAKGVYQVSITGDKGQTIATKKFVLQ